VAGVTNGGINASGDIAKSVVSSLGASPALLALICLNVAVLGLAAWVMTKREENQHAERMSLLERCYAAREK
jgi:hypothetical protein